LPFLLIRDQHISCRSPTLGYKNSVDVEINVSVAALPHFDIKIVQNHRDLIICSSEPSACFVDFVGNS
jgi:hypothetical protein